MRNHKTYEQWLNDNFKPTNLPDYWIAKNCDYPLFMKGTLGKLYEEYLLNLVQNDEPSVATGDASSNGDDNKKVGNSIELGVLKGEKCNRNGCDGIIDSHQKEGSCSCHINPPCSYCTTDNNYCPKCDWQGEDDQKSYGKESPVNIEFYKKEQQQFQDRREMFYKRYRGQEVIEKLEIWHESHTHFSQKLLGVFPKGTETRESILPKVKGTFGGRFERFTDTTFEYTAYTD